MSSLLFLRYCLFVVLAIKELTMETRLTSNSPCFCLSSGEIKGLHHHAEDAAEFLNRLLIHIFSAKKFSSEM